MTEKYQLWQEDEVAKQILEGYKATNLTPEQQDAFEALVDNVGGQMPRHIYGRFVRLVTKATGNRQLTVNLVDDFKVAVRDRNKWSKAGKDPVKIIGDEPRNNMPNTPRLS